MESGEESNRASHPVINDDVAQIGPELPAQAEDPGCFSPHTPSLLTEAASGSYAAERTSTQGWTSCMEQPAAAEALTDQAAEGSRQHRHHRHRRSAAVSSSSGASVVSGRSHSFSSGYASSCSSSGGACSSSSSSGGSSSVLSAAGCHIVSAGRPKSFTIGQVQAHKHRLAAGSTAACSSSPTGHGTTCTAKHSHSHSGCCSAAGSVPAAARGCTKAPHRPRPAVCTASAVLPKQGSGSQGPGQHKPLLSSFSGSGDWRGLCNSGLVGPQRRVLLAESVSVQDIGKGFKPTWYNGNTCRVLQLFDGSKPADPTQLLKHVPAQPGLSLWLVKPPCSRQWVPVRLDAAENLQQRLGELLHLDGSCGPPGSKQRVLLDLQCRGFSLQVRYRLLKPSAGSVQQDLLSKLQRFDFALNDTDNGGCRPIELPDGRPVHSYPWVAGAPMKVLYNRLFAQPKLA